MLQATMRKPLPAWGVQLLLFVGVVVAEAAADAELEAVVGVIRLVVWDSVRDAAYVRRVAGDSCRRGRSVGGALRRLGQLACCGLS